LGDPNTADDVTPPLSRKASLIPSALTKIRRAIASPGWAVDDDEEVGPEKRTETLRDLFYIRDHCDEATFEEISTEVSEALQRTSRPYTVEELHKLTDIRGDLLERAILSRHPANERFPGEEIYPNVDNNPNSWLGRFMQYANQGEAPAGYTFWSGLCVMASALRRNVYLDWGIFKIYPAPYVILVGETAYRKSTSIEIATDVLDIANDIIEAREAVENEQLRKDWGVQGAHSSMVKILPTRGSPDYILLDSLQGAENYNRHDVRSARDVKVWDGACGILACDELSTFVGKDQPGSSRAIVYLTDFFGCPSKRTEGTRKHGGKVLRNIALTLLGGTTQEWVRKEVNESMFRGGFMGRCIFVPRWVTRADQYKPKYLDPLTAWDIAESLAGFAMMKPRRVRVTAKANEWNRNWYAAHGKIHCEDVAMSAYYSRRQGHLLRVAMLLAVSEQGPDAKVTEEIMEWAWRILQVEEEALPRMFAEFQANPLEDTFRYVIDVMIRSDCLEGKPVGHSVLYMKTRWRPAIGLAENFRAVMSSLIEQDVVRMEPENAYAAKRYKGIRYYFADGWRETKLGQAVQPKS
jgi:hypothetical protein